MRKLPRALVNAVRNVLKAYRAGWKINEAEQEFRGSVQDHNLQPAGQWRDVEAIAGELADKMLSKLGPKALGLHITVLTDEGRCVVIERCVLEPVDVAPEVAYYNSVLSELRKKGEGTSRMNAYEKDRIERAFKSGLDVCFPVNDIIDHRNVPY